MGIFRKSNREQLAELQEEVNRVKASIQILEKKMKAAENSTSLSDKMKEIRKKSIQKDIDSLKERIKRLKIESKMVSALIRDDAKKPELALK